MRAGARWLELAALWRARRARLSAVRRLRPLVERSRMRDGMEAPDWSSDFALGFLVTLVTLSAGRSVDALSPEALGLVQVEAWGALTQLETDLVGTRVTLLSLDGAPSFLSGCEAALMFDAVLARCDAEGTEADHGDMLALWDHCAAGNPAPVQS